MEDEWSEDCCKVCAMDMYAHVIEGSYHPDGNVCAIWACVWFVMR